LQSGRWKCRGGERTEEASADYNAVGYEFDAGEKGLAKERKRRRRWRIIWRKDKTRGQKLS